MNEHKARFGKTVDAGALKDLKKIITVGSSPAIETGTDLLNIICAFATANPEATYSVQGTAIFETPETFMQAIKKADASALEKSWIQKIAIDVNQGEDTKGRLLEAVMNPNVAEHMVPFIVLFKIVFKMAQIGMTLKTKQNLVRKQDTMKKEMDDAAVQIDTQLSYIENLSFSERIQGEANRIRNEDVYTLQMKKNTLETFINNHI